MYFPEELWNEIKCYVGVYSISLNWDLMKLSLEELIEIIKMYIDKNIENNNIYLKTKKNMGSLKKCLINIFWKNINKCNLLMIYKKYTYVYNHYDYKLYTYNDLYLLDKYKRTDSYNFNDGETYYKKTERTRLFKPINITHKYIEIISINEDITEKPQKIKFKKNLKKYINYNN